MEKLDRMWALFETDELGNPEEKIMDSQGYPFKSDSGRPDGVDATAQEKGLDIQELAVSHLNIPTQLISRNWEATEYLRCRWQLWFSQNFEWKYAYHHLNGKQCDDNNGNHCSVRSIVFSEASSKRADLGKIFDETEDCDLITEPKFQRRPASQQSQQSSNRDWDMTLPTYRLHVESPEFFDSGFSAALVLSNTLIEQKVNCSGKELLNTQFLNLNHEGISSLGEGLLSLCCPKSRIFTADMNRLTTVGKAFVGYEDTLEQLSLKDNFLLDFSGLEHLQKLLVIHVDGNSILQISAPPQNLLSDSREPGSDGQVGARSPKRTKDGVPVLPTSQNMKYLPAYCWPALREFGLSYNRISKVERLGFLCPNLQILDLGSNNLSSLGWSQECALLGLKRLRVLDVGQNRLKGRSLWENLNHCPLLVSLVASRNQMEELPTHVGSVFLRELWLNGNSIKCFSCKAWMPNLQRLYLQDNEIDTLVPIWGFPSLEVLDLSFNKISDVQFLQELGCFSNLRSLQLNDNPVADLPDYTQRVLEAVPWLVELDNEPLTDQSRLQAVKNLFLNVMSAAGLYYVRSNVWQGKTPCLGVTGLDMQDVTLGGFTSCYDGFYPDCSVVRVNDREHKRDVLSVNTILSGKSDRSLLWSILLDMCEVYFLQYGKRNRPHEAQWKLQSFSHMCLNHKRRLVRESKANASQNLREHYIFDSGIRSNEVGCEKILQNSYISDLELCMWEHVQFNDNHHKDQITRIQTYETEIKLQQERIIKLQTVCRRFLSRRYSKDNERNTSKEIQPEKSKFIQRVYESKAATRIQAYWKRWKIRKNYIQTLALEKVARIQAVIKLQAHWRGFLTRKKFRLAMEYSKYEDPDEFDYVMVDESDFLPQNFRFEDVFSDNKHHPESRYGFLESPAQGIQFFLDKDLTCLDQSAVGNSEPSFLVHRCEETDFELEKHLEVLNERKVMVEIAKEWGFTHEKTALQFMKALENTKRRVKAPKNGIHDSKMRYKAFIATCERHNTSVNTSSSKLIESAHDLNLNGRIRDSAFGFSTNTALTKPKVHAQGKRFTRTSVTTLKLG